MALRKRFTRPEYRLANNHLAQPIQDGNICPGTTNHMSALSPKLRTLTHGRQPRPPLPTTPDG